MWFFLLSLFLLILGFVSGMWASFFVNSVQVYGAMTILDLLSLTFTILGGGAGFIATGFALFVYKQWLVQQRNSTIYNTKISLLTNICKINIYAANMLSARANPNIMNVNEHRVNLISSMSGISIGTDVLKLLDSNLESLAENIMKINHISLEVLKVKLWKDESDHMDSIYISSLHKWTNDFVSVFFDNIKYEPIGSAEIRHYQLSDINVEVEKLTKELMAELKRDL